MCVCVCVCVCVSMCVCACGERFMMLVWCGLFSFGVNKFTFLRLDVVLFAVAWFRIYAVVLFGSVLCSLLG